MGALKRKLGVGEGELAPGALLAARNEKVKEQMEKDLASDNTVKGVAIKGLI